VLWYLTGGPGGAGTSVLERLHARVSAHLPDVDLYTLDHRGTGGSEPLACPVQEAPASEGGIRITPAEATACIDHLRRRHGDRLAAMSTTQSALDLAVLIRATATGREVFVWGGSYGSYWAHRHLQLAGNQLTGAVLEALVPPGFSYAAFDDAMNEIGLAIMDRCEATPACRRHFAGSPRRQAVELRQRLSSGHCQRLQLATPVHWMLGSLLYDDALRAFVPPLVHRIARCNDADVVAVTRFHDRLFGEDGSLFAGTMSRVLYAHVVLSELWDDRPPRDRRKLREVAAVCAFCPGDRHELALARSRWPRYPLDPLAGKFATYSGPLLLLQGALDPASPVAEARRMSRRFTAAGQTYVEFPDGTHTLVAKTPTAGGDCAAQLLAAFLTDPASPVDAACVAATRPLQLDHFEPELTRWLWEDDDPWGD
jgi:pimeloyl-ACP methyl ester carboxylesterase